MTTRGWELLVKLKDGDTDWCTSKDLKEPYLNKLTIFTTNREIRDEPTFCKVGPVRVEETKANIAEDQVQLLVAHFQVWNTYTEEYSRIDGCWKSIRKMGAHFGLSRQG